MVMLREKAPLLLVGVLALAFGLAWVSNELESLQGWGSFAAVLLLGAGILLGSWRALQRESVAPWLGWLVAGAVVLRLGAGLLWFVGLPHWGYGTAGELAGYVMSDAQRRDMAAWELAQSDQPLLAAFRDYRMADQYGGLLFLSAGVYRYLGGADHQPLLMVVVTATFSALAVGFSWAFTRRLWGVGAAKAAAWLVALYPEAILLGSSQMREAFTMTLTAMALYGLITYWQDRRRSGLAWLLGCLGLSVVLSTLYAVLLAVMLVSLALVLDRGQVLRNWRLWAVLAVGLVIALVGVWLFAERIMPEGNANPLVLLNRWLKQAARWEARNTALSSGWMDKILTESPDWMNIWILLGYGVVQPFLPAALIAGKNGFWTAIAIWRALGWTIALFLLVYATVYFLFSRRKSWTAGAVSLLVWGGVVLSAYRGGGDQWDNPRYRLAFLTLQAAFIGWGWAGRKLEPNPWMRRVLVSGLCVFFWFIPWYLRRYFPQFAWPVAGLFPTLGLGLASMVLFWIWEWARARRGP